MTMGSVFAGHGSAMETTTVRMILTNRTAVSHLFKGGGWVGAVPAIAGGN